MRLVVLDSAVVPPAPLQLIESDSQLGDQGGGLIAPLRRLKFRQGLKDSKGGQVRGVQFSFLAWPESVASRFSQIACRSTVFVRSSALRPAMADGHPRRCINTVRDS